MHKQTWLSTKDNPYNPSTQFDEWLNYDNEKGYGSCALLGRVARTSDGLSESENNKEIERAIDLILQFDLTQNFIKVIEE